MPCAAVVAVFNDARSKDYNEIAEPLLGLIKDRKARKANPDGFVTRTLSHSKTEQQQNGFTKMAIPTGARYCRLLCCGGGVGFHSRARICMAEISMDERLW